MNIQTYKHTYKKSMTKITKELIGQKVTIEGTSSKISKEYLICVSADFECPKCGTIITVEQTGDKIEGPSLCIDECKWQKKFRLVHKELKDQLDFKLFVSEMKENITVYIRENKELMNKFLDISETNLKVTGIVAVENKNKSLKGDLVIYAEEIDEADI